ncbi:hypothetical protein [[Phormidium ambiguum] IAM M-71]|uniref:hypothetical protein n=1 Tax=[Phormidium ambiguum] IAM M-71 TaxID=454136 RepID=UPI001160FCF4|nr:hypothetical protein [Phormidium ambiguum]
MATTTRNGSRSSNVTSNSNGKSNGASGATANSKSRATASQSNGSSRPTATIEEQADALLARVRTTILKKFGVKIQLREKRLQTKIGHATKEKLGLDIAAQLKKNGKTMNWQRWNNEVFPALFGQPDALRHDIQVIALVMAKLYDVFELDPQEAIKGLVKFNQESLAKRNSYNKQDDEDDFDDLDSDEDEEEDDSEEDLDEDSEEDSDSEEDDDSDTEDEMDADEEEDEEDLD